jgi:hypothetical protein
MCALTWPCEDLTVTPSPPALPTNRAFLVQFRAQPPETPMAWEGRVEHVVSGQVTHFHTLEALLAFMRRVLTDEEPPTGRP